MKASSDKFPESTTSFSINSKLIENGNETAVTSESSENNFSTDVETLSSNGNEDWDKMLDDYEEYVTEYLKFYKQAMKGDQSALSEYPSLMEKATALSESMQQAQTDNQLNAMQINRMVKIQTKNVAGSNR